jgi:hypothetical protein
MKKPHDTKATRKPSENMQLPKALYAKMRHAIRLATRDSRRDDRSLHDVTRDALTEASDALEDFQDARTPGVKP